MICVYKGERKKGGGVGEKETERGGGGGRREGGREGERERQTEGEGESLHIHHNLAEKHVFQSQHCIRIVDGVKAFKCFVEIRKCCFKVFFFSM